MQYDEATDPFYLATRQAIENVLTELSGVCPPSRLKEVAMRSAENIGIDFDPSWMDLIDPNNEEGRAKV